MALVSTIKQHPIAILAVALAGLAGWAALDYAKIAQKETSEAPEPALYDEELPLPETLTIGASVGEERLRRFPPGNVTVSSLILPLLKPGMKRVEVESFLGPPTPDRIQPVTMHEGRMTYSTAYELALADIGPPMTIRPIRPQPRVATGANAPRSLIAFVFDAAEPGHPLVDILYPDPLF